MSPLSGTRTRVLVATFLVVCTVAAYGQVRRLGFVNYDDDTYVTANPQVQQGITAESVRWAWTTAHAANWHPITWMSHMLDWQLYGSKPAGHHLTSLLLHLANTVLLFWLLSRRTGAVGRSALVAALFALHPLHVESVAWVAERKDVLSGLFWLLATWAYVRYTESPRASRYAGMCAFFTLGLASKPMLVTFPFTLLLLDFWPLGRWSEGSPARNARLFWEKLPLFALAAASAIATLLVQGAGSATGSLEQYPFNVRMSNAAVSCAAYLAKAIWPSGLAVFYPYPAGGPPAWKVAVSVVALALVSAAATRLRRRYPYILFGWLWYLGTLVPVIGLVQVGEQAMADRYAYIPLLGIFVIASWGGADLLRALAGRWVPLASGLPGSLVPLGIAVIALAPATYVQTGYWRDSETLFARALAVTENSHVAHLNLALALDSQGRLDEAVAHYAEAVRIRPDHAIARNNLGFALWRRGDAGAAVREYEQALRIDPACAEAHGNLGIALAKRGEFEAATGHFAAALRARPDYPEAHFNWGTALALQARYRDAASHFSEAIRFRPDYAEAHYNLALALYFLGEYGSAWEHVRLAERHGYAPPARFLEMLASKTPER